MNFAWPDALPFLLAAPLLALVLFGLERRRARRLARMVGPRVRALAGPAPRGRYLFPVAVLFALLALVQPLWGEGRVPGERTGMDFVICLDVSRSMLARDIEPSRLERAQAAIRELAMHAAGDRAALGVFAGEARLVVPRTRDLASLAELAALCEPSSVRTGGSDLGSALDVALGTLAGSGAFVVLCDGEDHGGKGLRAAERCAAGDVTVHCVGVGTALGAKIPDGGGFLRDAQGNEVVTRLDPAGLRRIAERTGGAYIALDKTPLPEFHERSVRTSFSAQDLTGRANRFQWPLLAACLFWILDQCIGERRR